MAREQAELEELLVDISKASELAVDLKRDVTIVGLLSLLTEQPRSLDFQTQFKACYSWAKNDMKFQVSTAPEYLAQLIKEAEGGEPATTAIATTPTKPAPANTPSLASTAASAEDATKEAGQPPPIKAPRF